MLEGGPELEDARSTIGSIISLVTERGSGAHRHPLRRFSSEKQPAPPAIL
jgi:hypothetical protein